MRDISRDVIIQASEGDMNAFERIYKSSSGFVYNVAYRIVNNRDDAEEVTQEVFLTIYRTLKGFRFQASLRTWIYRITVNSAINYSRKKPKKDNATAEYSEGLKRPGAHDELEEKIDKEHREKIVSSMLKILNPEQRACVVLRNIECLSYQEIAETLDININTVRSRLKRAREQLMAHARYSGVENEL